MPSLLSCTIIISTGLITVQTIRFLAACLEAAFMMIRTHLLVDNDDAAGLQDVIACKGGKIWSLMSTDLYTRSGQQGYRSFRMTVSCVVVIRRSPAF